MGSGAKSTNQNWANLRRLARRLFRQLHAQNPSWDYEDLQRHLNLPSSKMLMDLASEAGITRTRSPPNRKIRF